MWQVLLSVIYLLVPAIAVPIGGSGCIQGSTCSLPECFCPNSNSPDVDLVPGSLEPPDIPQIVSFSFDDAVNIVNYKFYNQLFPADGTRKNPNGCPISMTMFVSHNYTDYGMVKSLYDRGMEIASHSATHRTPTTFWETISKEDMMIEAKESKRLISTRAGIPQDKIKGWRFPFLQPGGDVSFEVLRQTGYEYDASLLVSGTTGSAHQQWPLTLDYGFPATCVLPPCPVSSLPSFWEVPVVPISDREDIFHCSYIDGCFYQPTNKREALEILLKNFTKNYTGKRAPLYINMHAAWFTTDFKLEAMDDFIKAILEMEDVYIVNFQQLLEWVRQPTKLGNISTFKPWQCSV